MSGSRLFPLFLGDDDAVVGGGDGDVAAFFEYCYGCAEVAVARYAAQIDVGLERGVGKFILEIIPSAQVAHYVVECLAFKYKASVTPACDDRGLDLFHLHLAVVVVIDCLLAGREKYLASFARGLTQ